MKCKNCGHTIVQMQDGFLHSETHAKSENDYWCGEQTKMSEVLRFEKSGEEIIFSAICGCKSPEPKEKD